jgi:hypothetical protein
MRLIASTAVFVVLLLGASAAADRKWQTGTWADIATKRTPWVGNPSGGTEALTVRSTGTAMTEVAAYVIETDDQRIELEDVVAIGARGSIDAQVTVGAPVSFALNKKTAYVRLADGKEYRLRVTRQVPRTRR